MNWGMNILAADGDMWWKHRRIMDPPSITNCVYMRIVMNIPVSQLLLQLRGGMGRDAQDVHRDGCRRGMDYAGPRHCPRGADPNIQGTFYSSVRMCHPLTRQ